MPVITRRHWKKIATLAGGDFFMEAVIGKFLLIVLTSAEMSFNDVFVLWIP